MFRQAANVARVTATDAFATKFMREPEIITIADLLFWSYASVGMAQRAVYDVAPEYQKVHFIIRNRLWSGLRRGTFKIGSPLKDFRTKMRRPTSCVYCGSSENISADHLIPKVRGGEESADNFLLACRSCNSSKGGLDVLEWYRKRDVFPPLFVLRVYLKQAIRYCQKHDLMNRALHDANPTPFSFGAIPTQFPPPGQLTHFVSPR